MTSDAPFASALAQADAAGRAAAVAASATLAAAAADAGIAASVDGATVTFTGRGLVARAFGSRTRAADPRLAFLAFLLGSRR